MPVMVCLKSRACREHGPNLRTTKKSSAVDSCTSAMNNEQRRVITTLKANLGSLRLLFRPLSPTLPSLGTCRTAQDCFCFGAVINF